MIIKFIIDIVSGALFWWGGKNFVSARRYILPTVLTVYAGFTSHELACLSMLISIAVFDLGYGDKSFFRHCFGDGWGRGVWGLLGGLALSIWAICTGHFGCPSFITNAWFVSWPPLIWFVIYNASCFTLENVLKKLNQNIGDPLICIFSFGSIVWFVK